LSNIRLLLISDIHGNISAVKKLVNARYRDRKKIDAIVITGDLPATVPFELIMNYILNKRNLSRVGYSIEVYQRSLRSKYVAFQIKSISVMIPMLEKLNLPIYYIPGNVETREAVEYIQKKHSTIHFIENKVETINNKLNLVGLGGSLDHLGLICDYEFREDKFNQKVLELSNLISKPINRYPYIFAFHEPPLFTRNVSQHLELLEKEIKRKRGYYYNFPRNGGSSALHKLIVSFSPILVINGHYHELSGKRIINSSPVVNPGALAVYQYGIATIENHRINIKFYRIRPSPFSFINLVYNKRLFHQGDLHIHY